MRTAKLWRRAAILAALTLFVGSTAYAQAGDYGPAKTAYDDYVKRPSLQMRSRGRIKLCASGDLRALQIMADTYGLKHTPIDQERYLIASIAAQYFGGEDSVDIWKKWREKFTTTGDAWLWYRSLIVQQSNKGDDELIATLADTKKDTFIRAAALEALAECNSDKILEVLDPFIDEVRKMKDIQRTVFTESCIRALYARSHNLGSVEFRKPAMKLIEMIDEKETAARTKLIIARYLRAILGGDKLYINSKPWAWMLVNPGKALPNGEGGKDGRYAEPPKPKFVGLEASGSRIAYVIDLSDSMCTPMTVKEKEEIKKPPPPKPRGPITGGDEPGRQGPDGGPEKPKEEPKEPEKKKELSDDIDWSKVKNRFDCAREYLKLSLKGLQPTQYYCVIMFGSAAEFAKSTKQLVLATPQNIANTIRELDAIKPGSATPMRKHGTLRGDTNLHGGLHRAWKVRTNGMGKEWEYVDPAGFPDGADTVFLLSDGDPTDDDWAVEDKRDKDDQTGDPESNTKLPDQDRLRFPAPYGYRYESIYLPDDIRRINLFRKAEINCIGIGEVSAGLLSNIAKAALDGEVKMVGK